MLHYLCFGVPFSEKFTATVLEKRQVSFCLHDFSLKQFMQENFLRITFQPLDSWRVYKSTKME